MKKPHQPDADLAWAAGLFEGEGCVSAYVRRNGSVQMQIRLEMTDGDVVERFALIMGCGNVSIRPPQREHWLPLHSWRVYEAEKVRDCIQRLLPFLGKRRTARAQEVLRLGADVRSHNTKKTHCPQGHPLSGDNLIEEPIKRGEKPYTARRCRKCRRQKERERARKRLGVKPENYRVKE